MTEPMNVIYPPPRSGLPYLVVTIAEKHVEIIPARTPTEARSLAVKLARKRSTKPKLKAEVSI
jgi:hypothetical protein